MITAGFTSLALLLCGSTSPSPTDAYSPRHATLFARSLLKGMEVIAEGHVTPVTESQLTRWAIRGLYEALGEPLPATLQRRLQRLERGNNEEMLQLLIDARFRLGGRKDLEETNDLKLCMQAIFMKLEPGAGPWERSQLVSPRMFCCRFGSTPVGVGLQLTEDPATGMLRVKTPIFKGPAYNAGIRAGDLITGISSDTDSNGQPLSMPPFMSTKGMSVERAHALLLGQDGTRVVLSVIPAAPGQRNKTP